MNDETKIKDLLVKGFQRIEKKTFAFVFIVSL